MYDTSGQDDNNDQSSSRMNPYDLQLTSEERAKMKASEFVREQRYKTLLRGGLNPQQAASMMGVKLRSGDRFKPIDVLRMVVKGRKKNL